MSTMKDVANRAGVTVTTVSRIINDRGYISDATRTKVHRVMKELDYQPNELARALSMRRTNIIGIIVPSLMDPYFCEVVNYLEYYASGAGYKVMICNSNNQKDKEQEYISMLKSNKVSGIVLSSWTKNLENILPANLPVITFERVISNQISSITCDNYSGGEIATRYLLDIGCKNLLHISGTNNIKMPADSRRDAFVRVCEGNQIPYKVFYVEDTKFQSQDYYADLEQIIVSNPEIDGIFTSSDVIAADIISLCSKNNIQIPSDIKLIGFDDTRLMSLITPKITTIHQPIEQMCSCAINTLIHQIEEGYLPTRTVLPVTFIKRESA